MLFAVDTPSTGEQLLSYYTRRIGNKELSLLLGLIQTLAIGEGGLCTFDYFSNINCLVRIFFVLRSISMPLAKNFPTSFMLLPSACRLLCLGITYVHYKRSVREEQN